MFCVFAINVSFTVSFNFLDVFLITFPFFFFFCCKKWRKGESENEKAMKHFHWDFFFSFLFFIYFCFCFIERRHDHGTFFLVKDLCYVFFFQCFYFVFSAFFVAFSFFICFIFYILSLLAFFYSFLCSILCSAAPEAKGKYKSNNRSNLWFIINQIERERKRNEFWCQMNGLEWERGAEGEKIFTNRVFAVKLATLALNLSSFFSFSSFHRLDISICWVGFDDRKAVNELQEWKGEKLHSVMLSWISLSLSLFFSCTFI